MVWTSYELQRLVPLIVLLFGFTSIFQCTNAPSSRLLTATTFMMTDHQNDTVATPSADVIRRQLNNNRTSDDVNYARTSRHIVVGGRQQKPERFIFMTEQDDFQRSHRANVTSVAKTEKQLPNNVSDYNNITTDNTPQKSIIPKSLRTETNISNQRSDHVVFAPSKSVELRIQSPARENRNSLMNRNVRKNNLLAKPKKRITAHKRKKVALKKHSKQNSHKTISQPSSFLTLQSKPHTEINDESVRFFRLAQIVQNSTLSPIILTAKRSKSNDSGKVLAAASLQEGASAQLEDKDDDDYMPFQYVIQLRERKSFKPYVSRKHSENEHGRFKYKNRGFTHVNYRKIERLEETHYNEEEWEREHVGNHKHTYGGREGYVKGEKEKHGTLEHGDHKHHSQDVGNNHHIVRNGNNGRFQRYKPETYPIPIPDKDFKINDKFRAWVTSDTALT